MTKCIGAKIVELTSMNRKEYNDYRGWQLPENENGADEGYLVEYQDGGAPNDGRHAGYISWSPKEVADKSYRPIVGLPFGQAVEALKIGKKVTRSGWNGKGMFLFLVPGSHFTVNRAPLLGIYPEGTEIDYLPHIDMTTAQGSIVPWLASQSDILADDWQIVE